MTTESVPVTESPVSNVSEMAKKLSPEEMGELSRLHRQSADIIQNLGQMEVRKARLISNLSEIEERAQKAMAAVGTRLGIPEGEPWQVNPDGTISILKKGA